MNRKNRLRHVPLVLALLLLAAIETGVAASAAKTVIPRRLTGAWGRGGDNYGLIVVSTRGKIEIKVIEGAYHAKFSRVTAHRLTVSYVPGLTVSALPSCSRKGTYRWKVANHQLELKKIHDACEPRVGLFAGVWLRARTAP